MEDVDQPGGSNRLRLAIGRSLEAKWAPLLGMVAGTFTCQQRLLLA